MHIERQLLFEELNDAVANIDLMNRQIHHCLQARLLVALPHFGRRNVRIPVRKHNYVGPGVIHSEIFQV